jgi:hypothetical protein
VFIAVVKRRAAKNGSSAGDPSQYDTIGGTFFAADMNQKVATISAKIAAVNSKGKRRLETVLRMDLSFTMMEKTCRLSRGVHGSKTTIETARTAPQLVAGGEAANR